MGEPLVQLLVGVQHQALPLSALLALSHQSGVLIPLEQTRHLAVGQQSVHSLQEPRVHDIAFVKDEADLFIFAAAPPQHLPQVLVEVLGAVLVVHLDLEHSQPVHPRHKPGEGRFPCPGDSNEKEMALRLPEDSVNPENMVQDFVKEDQRNIKLLLVEDFQSGLGVVAKLVSSNRNVVLAQPVAEQDRPSKCLLPVDVGEVPASHRVDIRVGPHALFLLHQTILEQAESLVGPESDKTLHVESLQGPDGLADTPHPPSHFSGAVNIVGLHVLSEPVLRHQVELHHGVGERFSKGAKRRNHSEHGPVEGAVDLLQAGFPRVVHVDYWHMAEEPRY